MTTRRAARKRPNPADPRKLQKALALWEAFTGQEGEVAGTTEVGYVDGDEVLVAIGECEAIAYRATRAGRTHSYQHEFKPSARPVLAASHDGKRLYLLAGAYRFTARGIEDR